MCYLPAASPVSKRAVHVNGDTCCQERSQVRHYRQTSRSTSLQPAVRELDLKATKVVVESSLLALPRQNSQGLAQNDT